MQWLRSWWVVGGALLVLAGGGYYAFAVLPGGAHYDTLVLAPGTFSRQITVSGTVVAAQNVDLGFAQSGRITRIGASVGDTVGQGALLAEVENGDLRAALAQKQAALMSAQANLDLLLAGTRPEQLAVTQAQVASDQAALGQANQALLNALEAAYTTADDAVHNTVDQFFVNPRTTTPQLSFTTANSQLEITVESDRVTLEQVLAAWQRNVSALTTQSDLSAAATQAQQDLSLVAGLLADANAALNAGVPSAAVSQSSLTTYLADVAAARTSVETQRSALTTALSAQAAAAAALQKDQKSLALEQAGSTAQAIDAQRALVGAAQADVQNAQALLAKTQVLAPFAGTVTRMDAKVGETVSPSTPEISMMSNGIFQIETYVPEVDIASLKVGDQATSTLDAYGPSVPFAATVTAIDPARTVKDGVSTYKTTLTFTAADARIRSGMTANVVIETDRIPNVLAIPTGALYSKDGQQTVQVLQAGKPLDRAVTTGTSSLGQAVITAGLAPGDIVILNPDTSK